MKIKFSSAFKTPSEDQAWFKNWVSQLEKSNRRVYEKIEVSTGLGKTMVYGLGTSDVTLEPLVIFPGARTTALIWDFDRNLDQLLDRFRIYLVETNGLPNLSDGDTPDIKSLDYGHWAAEVMGKLRLELSYVAGASFGGLICMKLCIAHPEKVKTAFLYNPGCLQPFSLALSNLYYNLLPILSPNRKNVEKFLKKAIFHQPEHFLSATAWDLLVDYELFALTRYRDKTQKPYFMNKELTQVQTAVYLALGEQDLLFPAKKSLSNAKGLLPNLKTSKIFLAGHGVETLPAAMLFLKENVAKLENW
ncbi:alpha/beta hydrolase [Algoriphagus terrigena]|uniref:alpha/beta hydrolase n=1 Tax=Algoriphagus terrigena TaxID=344884 RepID=UPI0003F697EC|nr:alpha/beta hydrolase [Algoriphagus terrigena]